jgi:hypothetical protein
MPLHLTRVAYGATSLAELVRRIESRAESGEVRLTTRFLPKRHTEILEGGSLYWIVKHQLVARAVIKGFEATPEGRTDMVLEARVIPVRPLPRRAHQGWRYLEAADAPGDLGGDSPDEAALPPSLLRELAELALL